MSSLINLSATEMREGLLGKDFSAVELTSAHLARIEQTNSKFNSFLAISKENALADAKAADADLAARGNDTPLLTGIPLAVKDMLCTKGIETTCASKILKGFIPPYDCTALARLKQAVAVVLGKTNLAECSSGSSNDDST